ncbi:GNAT family N-acetyltransferase [Bradyrhizobium sp. LTSPM299]|jgi:putative acetyltransferase|uniref:GNAT family N-acetyltransferase n=1 Tax=Bradyrhizobium sp. LTSPM299 TaxID=1619233 RepID=UPI0005C8BE9A|nr:GNAT family N-acetyltransferase [Bradyrhizobium sp. LTSPM299]
MSPVYRRATRGDAIRLFEIRRTSILELASKGIPADEAAAWAMKLTPAGMEQKLRELKIWVAESDGIAAGWGAIRGGYLEGLYMAPEFAGRGIGGGLLAMLESLMRSRGVREIRAEASSNALDFYLQRGYRATAPQTPDGAWPIAKQLQ